MIDANFNRAREGLRVIEDIARFILDDKKIAKDIKDLRASVGEIERIYRFTDFRDTEGDVGRTLSTELEKRRDNVEDITIANIKRVQESFRVLEEAFKLIDITVSEKVKTLRYNSYALEKEILERVRDNKR